MNLIRTKWLSLIFLDIGKNLNARSQPINIYF